MSEDLRCRRICAAALSVAEETYARKAGKSR